MEVWINLPRKSVDPSPTIQDGDYSARFISE